MRLVDEPEVAFQAVHDTRVRPEQRLVGAQHVLERGLPPGVFELGRDAIGRDVPHRQLGEQPAQPEPGEFGAQGGALDQIVENIGFCGQAGQSTHQGLDRQ